MQVVIARDVGNLDIFREMGAYAGARSHSRIHAASPLLNIVLRFRRKPRCQRLLIIEVFYLLKPMERDDTVWFNSYHDVW